MRRDLSAFIDMLQRYVESISDLQMPVSILWYYTIWVIHSRVGRYDFRCTVFQYIRVDDIEAF